MIPKFVTISRKAGLTLLIESGEMQIVVRLILVKRTPRSFGMKSMIDVSEGKKVQTKSDADTNQKGALSTKKTTLN